MPAIHTRTFAVPRHAIDVNGHVNNLEYLRWMQEVATEHSAVQGWPVERYLTSGTVWVVKTHFIEYLAAAFEGDLLSLHTWVADIRSSSSRRRYLFSRGGDGRPIARAETLWVLVDARTGRARRIPDELRSAFTVATEEEVKRLSSVAGA